MGSNLEAGTLGQEERAAFPKVSPHPTILGLQPQGLSTVVKSSKERTAGESFELEEAEMVREETGNAVKGGGGEQKQTNKQKYKAMRAAKREGKGEHRKYDKGEKGRYTQRK